MLRPTLPALALTSVALLCLAGSVVALGLWFHPRAPRIVRLLPPGETLAYLDLEPLRTAGWLDGDGTERLPGTASPAYAAFVRESGFDFERDLDDLACSLDGPPLHPARTTCVLEGRFGPQFWDYLRTQGQHRLELSRGEEAFQFPGWAQPQRPMYIVPLDSTRVMATNADPAAAVGWARRWWASTPELWRVRAWSPPPIAYVALDARHLSTTGAWDNSQPPWRWVQTLHASVLIPFNSGLTLEGEEQTADPADAAAARDWLLQNLSAVRGLLPAGNADPAQPLSLAALLDRVQLRLQGSRLGFSLHLDPASVRQWSGARQ